MTLILIGNNKDPLVFVLRERLATEMGATYEEIAGTRKTNEIDSKLGAAIRRWQSGIGIIADGIVGPRCMQLLGLRASKGLSERLPVDIVRSLFPATKPANVVRYWPYVCAALEALGIDDRPMVLAALGTIRAESDGFVPISEMPSQFNTPPGGPPFALYDGRLGNTGGEGSHFKGRGFVQLTGHANYTEYGTKLGIAIDKDPDSANAPEIAAAILAAYLADRATEIRSALQTGRYAKARKLVNGGSHGLDRFKSVFDSARAAWPESVRARVPSDQLAARTARRAHSSQTVPATITRVRTVTRDPTDLRDRLYSPPPACLDASYPSDHEIEQFIGNYFNAGLVLDQGEEGACTGFGLACVINFMRWRIAGFDPSVASVSPRMLYTFARRYDEYAGENYDGSSCRGALKGWFNHGVCLESDWPFKDRLKPPKYGYADRAARCTLGAYYRIDLTSISDLQGALQQVGAVYVSAYTHDGWDNIATRKKTPKAHVDLPRIAFDGRPSRSGGHAFALVGFNEDGFVIQNSWGPAFGAGGFAVLTYADWLANAMDAWVLALGVPGVLSGMASTKMAPAGRALASDTSQWWTPDVAYEHSVVLGNDGRVARYLTEDEINRKLMHQACVLPDQWFRSSAAGKRKRLVIYVHGGLNAEEDAVQRARAMGRVFAGNDCYPLFIVWKTGLMESIGDILSDKFGGDRRAGGLSDFSDLLIEKSVARPLAKPIWSEMKENAALAFESGRGGELLIDALIALYGSWGPDLEVHLVGHSAGSIFIGHLVYAMARRQTSGVIRSINLFAPACTVEFANRYYAPQPDLMQRLSIHLLSDRVERNDNVASIYRKSLLYLVSNALESDLRTPLLGLANTYDPDYPGWDGTSSTTAAIKSWLATVKATGITSRMTIVDDDTMLVRHPLGKSTVNDVNIKAAHGAFDNDIGTLTAALKRICGKDSVKPPDDLQDY